MSWLVLVAITVIADTIRIYIDNFVSDTFFKGRDSVAQKYFYGFAFVIIGSLTCLFSAADFADAPFSTVFLFIFSGLLASLGGIPYYRALEIDNSTNIGIFFQVAPVLYLIIGYLFLGENPTLTQLIAIPIIIAAPLIVVFSSGRKSRGNRFRALFLTLLYVLIATVGNMIFVTTNNGQLTFPSEIALMLLGKGLGNIIIILLNPKWHRRFRVIFRANRPRILVPFIGNTVLSLTKDLAYRSALIVAPTVAIASVTSDSLEPVLIFFFGIVLTLIWPNFGREKLTRKNVATHLISTIFVVIGIILLQI